MIDQNETDLSRRSAEHVGGWVPTPEMIAATKEAEAAMDTDPMARIRPIVAAVWDTVREMAPMIPNALIGKALTENEVYRFLMCLEKHGYTIAPVDPVLKEAVDKAFNAMARPGEF